MAIIAEVRPNSLASELGLEPGDKIVEVNNIVPEDLIHFQYLWADEEIKLLVETKTKEEILYEIEKDYDEGLGVVFEQAVFDKIRPCHNKCLFCFIEQMAPEMRPSLYEKDDDYRLSFLQGNFITLTNIKEADLKRIKDYHLSPLYVSVHTTNKVLRKELMGNPKADRIMEQLQDLINSGINIHTQIVLCPGINDGEYLEKTINDLSSLWPGVQSIAIVPVGVTKFRKDLAKFPVFDKKYAEKLVEQITEKQIMFREKTGISLVYLGDEIYVQAQKDFPDYEFYDSFPQTENGIGVSRLFLDEFKMIKDKLPKTCSEDHFIIATSVLGSNILKPVLDELNLIKGLNVELKVIENVFFGSRVTVTGLLTGTDLIQGLQGTPLGTKVIISDIMLKKGENIFLDGLNPEEVGQKLGIELIVVENNAEALLDQIILNVK
ncbi:MAG: DUF512 domain-containing protein [Peptococcales bacterium]|jgi:putative radical SAM enzyme (TIGR03279 family)